MGRRGHRRRRGGRRRGGRRRPSARQWVLGDDGGPQWLATLDPVASADDRRSLLAAYESAAELARRLSFVVAPVHARDGRIAVAVAPGTLLSVAPFLEGTAVDAAALADDQERCVLANMMGDLHRQRRPRPLPLWRPAVGRTSGGPARGPGAPPGAGRVVGRARGRCRRTAWWPRRGRCCGRPCAASRCWPPRWPATPSAGSSPTATPTPATLVRTPDGHRLVGWGNAARAPRERDLGEALAGAEGGEPWFAYLEAGGRPDPLSPDTLELFDLQRRLSRHRRAGGPARRPARGHPAGASLVRGPGAGRRGRARGLVLSGAWS